MVTDDMEGRTDQQSMDRWGRLCKKGSFWSLLINYWLLSDFALTMQLIDGFGEFYPGMILAICRHQP
jgi:hypothetical protein